MAVPAWHPDPLHRHELRWFDGNAWTAQVSDGGVVGVDPMGTAPGTKRSGGRAVALVIGIVAVAAIGAGAFFLLGGNEDDDSLSDEIAGVRSLLDGASPDSDDFEHLGDDCVVDVVDILTDAGVDVPDDAEVEEAAAYAAAGFDRPFYDCYVAVGSLGYALDAVEIGTGATVDDLEDLLDGIADDVDRVDDDLADGAVIEACTDAEVIGVLGDRVDDTFCEYYWTFDRAGLAIVAAAHGSLGMNGPNVLEVAVPAFLEALAEAAE